MKIFFLASSYATIYLIFMKFKATYNRNHDTFRFEILLAVAGVLALLLNHEFSVTEVRKLLFYYGYKEDRDIGVIKSRHYETSVVIKFPNLLYFRYYGRSPFTWNQLLFYHSYL